MAKVTGQCPQTTTFLKWKESRSGIEPRSFRLPRRASPEIYPLSETEPNFPTLPTYQFSRPTGGCGREKGGGRVLHCCHPRCSRSGTINIIILGRSSAGRGRKPEILTKQSLSSRINKYRLKNSQLKYSRPEDTGKLKKERNSTKLHKTTKLQTVPGENETNKRQKDKTQLKTKYKK